MELDDQVDKAFEIPTQQVQEDGLIVGTIKGFGVGVDLGSQPAAAGRARLVQRHPADPGECQQKVGDAVQQLAAGIDGEAALKRLLRGILPIRPRSGDHLFTDSLL